MEMLLECVDSDSNKSIDYVEFVNFLNWKDKMPTGFQKNKQKNGIPEATVESSKQEDYDEKILQEVKTSSTSLNEEGQLEAGALKNQIDSSLGKEATSSSVYKSNLLNELIKGSFKFNIIALP